MWLCVYERKREIALINFSSQISKSWDEFAKANVTKKPCTLSLFLFPLLSLSVCLSLSISSLSLLYLAPMTYFHEPFLISFLFLHVRSRSQSNNIKTRTLRTSSPSTFPSLHPPLLPLPPHHPLEGDDEQRKERGGLLGGLCNFACNIFLQYKRGIANKLVMQTVCGCMPTCGRFRSKIFPNISCLFSPFFPYILFLP